MKYLRRFPFIKKNLKTNYTLALKVLKEKKTPKIPKKTVKKFVYSGKS